MKYDVLHNFISPVTGRILADVEDYILVGDKQGIAIPSPILIDMRLDFINLRRDYDYLRNASIVIGFPNLQLSKAQVLSNLEDGILVTTKGVLSTTTNILTELPDLTYKYIWRGDENNRPVESDTLTNLEEDVINIKLTLPDIIATAFAEFLLLLPGIIAGIIANSDVVQIHLEGFVSGSLSHGIIVTSVQNDASMNGFRLTDLKPNPEADFDAVSFNFLWDLMHDEVDILWQ